MSNSLWPHGLQHARLPCPSPSPGVCSNSCLLSCWCHRNHLILCCPLLLLPSLFPSIRIFPNESALCVRWPKYWSFSVSPSNEYSGLISFRMTRLISLQSKDSQESSPTPQLETINSSAFNLPYGPTLTSLVAQMVKHLCTMWETWAWSLGQEDSLEKEMATHSSTLA